MADETAAAILTAVDRYGVLLVHDQVLPSVTALVAGGPVSGSWWSHPEANRIYNALGALDDQVATVKLLNAKSTLVARRLWSHLAGVGAAGDEWQTVGLDHEALAVLALVERSPVPVVVDRAERPVAERLERRLLVYTTDIHTPSGHHVKGHQSWGHWANERHVTPTADSAAARAAFEQLAAAQARPGGRVRLPW